MSQLAQDFADGARSNHLALAGEDVTYTPSGESPVTIKAIRRELAIAAETKGVATNHRGYPVMLLISKADVPSPTRNQDTINLPAGWISADDAENVRVGEVNDAGNGMWMIFPAARRR